MQRRAPRQESIRASNFVFVDHFCGLHSLKQAASVTSRKLLGVRTKGDGGAIGGRLDHVLPSATDQDCLQRRPCSASPHHATKLAHGVHQAGFATSSKLLAESAPIQLSSTQAIGTLDCIQQSGDVIKPLGMARVQAIIRSRGNSSASELNSDQSQSSLHRFACCPARKMMVVVFAHQPPSFSRSRQRIGCVRSAAPSNLTDPVTTTRSDWRRYPSVRNRVAYS